MNIGSVQDFGGCPGWKSRSIGGRLEPIGGGPPPWGGGPCANAAIITMWTGQDGFIHSFAGWRGSTTNSVKGSIGAGTARETAASIRVNNAASAAGSETTGR